MLEDSRYNECKCLDKPPFYRFKTSLYSQPHIYLQVNAAECIYNLPYPSNHAVLSPPPPPLFLQIVQIRLHISAARQRMLLEIP